MPLEVTIDSTTWAALALTLTIIGGALSWVAWRRRDLIDGYRYPLWLVLIGTAAWMLTIYIGYKSLTGLGDLF